MYHAPTAKSRPRPRLVAPSSDLIWFDSFEEKVLHRALTWGAKFLLDEVELLQGKLVQFVFHLPDGGLLDLVDGCRQRIYFGLGLPQVRLVRLAEVLGCSLEEPLEEKFTQ